MENANKKEIAAGKADADNRVHKLVLCFAAVLILLQICCSIFYARQKQGYFVDELWSYGLANSYYHPDVYTDGALEDKWVAGEYFGTYLEASSDHRFTYGSVLSNQRNESLPPLFYAILHTVCSLFPDSFSKWYGIIPNLFYMMGVNVLLFLLARKLFKNEVLALLPMLIYGFSAGAFSTVIYIRMYMLLNLFVMAALYFIFKWMDEETIPLGELPLFLLLTYLGCMTHYYFFAFLFFSAALFMGILYVNKRKVDMWKYGLTVYASLVVIAFTYPTAFEKIFTGDASGAAGHKGLQLGTYLRNLYRYYNILGDKLAAGLQNLVLLVVIVLIVALVIRGKIVVKKQYFHDLVSRYPLETQKLLLLAGVFIGCFLFIVRVAPYRADRYISFLFPVLVLLCFYILELLLTATGLSAMRGALVLGILFLGLNVKGVVDQRVQYIYSDYKDNVSIARGYEGGDCIYVTRDFYKLAGNALELAEFGRVRAIVPDHIDQLNGILDQGKDKLVVYLDESLDQEKVIREVLAAGGFKQYSKLFTSRCIAYEVSK